MVRPLSHHQHSGKRLPHHHTSFAALTFLVLLAGALLTLVTSAALASMSASGQVDISAVVNGAAPTQPPVITNPVDDQRFVTSPIPVEGTCTVNYKVVLYRNGFLAGSGICRADGTFSIKSALSEGRNEFKARQYDGLDQASPDSLPVVVYLDVAKPAEPVSEFVILSDSPYKTAQANDEITWPIQVMGGTPPYAISWNWGDGSVDVISMTSPGAYHGRHVYTKPGIYKIIIKGSDSKGRTAYLELVAIIGGGDVGPATAKPSGWFDGGLLVFLWPLYFLILAMIISFWLGERYEFFKVKQRLLGWRRDPYQGMKP